MVWNRDEYISHMTFEYTGKELFTEIFGLMVDLDKQWFLEGASEAEINLSAFGWDNVKHAFVGANTGAKTDITPSVIVDNDEYTISVDRMGRKQKLCKGSATIPLPMEYPVSTYDDWLKIKHWYEFSEDRINVNNLTHLKYLRDNGYLIIINIPGGFDEPRQLLGEENLCISYYEQPELIKDILDTIADTSIKVFERVLKYVNIDQLFVHEDMAGKSGPLAGPDQVREFITPYYKRLWEPLKDSGAKLFSQDSDGNMNCLIDEFLEAGINIMFPFEPGSGMDMVKTRKKYGKRLAIKGGIDKYVLRAGKEDIRRELEYKINDLTMGGGTAFSIDHRIPNGVPIENYRYYVNYGRELLGLPKVQTGDFVRMGF